MTQQLDMFALLDRPYVAAPITHKITVGATRRNFIHECRRCGYSVILHKDHTRISVCPKCRPDAAFKVTPTDRPAIDEAAA